MSEFGENVFSNNGSVIFCKICEIRVYTDKRHIVTQHLKTGKHSRVLNRHQNTKTSKVQ